MDALNLDVKSADQETLIITPAIEVGARINLESGHILRTYAQAGVSFLSDDEWSQDARFVTSPTEVDGFTTSMPMGDVVGNFVLGAQLEINEQTSLFVQYQGQHGSHGTTNGAGAGLKWLF